MNIVGCFLEFDDKFVILRRHSHKPNGDTWGLPAGKVEDGESPIQALTRELQEETGYEAADDEPEHLGLFPFGNDTNAYEFNAYRIKLCSLYTVKVEESAHSEYRWVTAEECYSIPNLIPDFHELLRLLDFVW